MVDSTGTNIGAHSLAVPCRDDHRPKWSFRPSWSPMRGSDSIIHARSGLLPFPFETFVEFGTLSRQTSLWAVFVSFAFYRVLVRPRILLNSNRLFIVLRLKPYFHSRFRKTHRLSKGIENIKKTSARRFVTRRGSSRRSRSRRLDFSMTFLQFT